MMRPGTRLLLTILGVTSTVWPLSSFKRLIAAFTALGSDCVKPYYTILPCPL